MSKLITNKITGDRKFWSSRLAFFFLLKNKAVF